MSLVDGKRRAAAAEAAEPEAVLERGEAAEWRRSRRRRRRQCVCSLDHSEMVHYEGGEDEVKRDAVEGSEKDEV